MNNSNVLTKGYWTSTVNASDETMAWYINGSSKLSSTSVSSSDIGLRPVITIYKTEIK